MDWALLSESIRTHRWEQVANAIGEKIATEGLISIRNGSPFEDVHNSSRFGYEREQVTVIKLGQMHRTLRRLTSSKLAGRAPNGLPSQGILATALALSLGSRAVHLDGFQFLMSKYLLESEPFYNERVSNSPDKVPRFHSSSDLLCLASMAILDFKITSKSVIIRSALQNLGDEGQDVFKPSLRTRVLWSMLAPW